MDGDRTDDQRRHFRRAFDQPVRVDGRPARGVDLSMGGMRVAQIAPAPQPGRIVLVEFVLPGGEAVATRAEVLRNEEGIYVLRFVRLDPGNLLKLANFANQLAA